MNFVVRYINLTTRIVSTIAGTPGINGSQFADGQNAVARFHAPTGIALDPTGTYALIVSRVGCIVHC